MKFDLKGKIVSPLVLWEIIDEISKGNFVMASVNYDIKNTEISPKTKGGHLVLILGYDSEKEILYFHNPSGDTQENQEYAQISFWNFKKSFDNKGIIIY